MIQNSQSSTRLCFTVALLLAFCLASISCVDASDTDENNKLFAAIKESQVNRERIYDNGHFVWVETDTDGASIATTHYEYWANRGQSFRLDSFTLNDGKPVGDIRRLISTPQGTTLVIAKSVLDPGLVATSTSSAICENGRCPPTIANITGRNFVAHANRYATIQVKDVIEHWEQKGWDLKYLKVQQDDANACVINFTREKPEGIRTGTVTMDPETYRVRSWTYGFEGKLGRQHAKQYSVLVYGQGNAEIPLEEHSVAFSNFGQINSTSLRLVEFDLTPADPGEFLLPPKSVTAASPAVGLTDLLPQNQ